MPTSIMRVKNGPVTRERMITLCLEDPEGMWDILSKDLGFNEEQFFEKIMSINFGAGKAFFGHLLGKPFEGHDLESVIELIEYVHNNPTVMGRVCYFIYTYLDQPKLQDRPIILTNTKEQIEKAQLAFYTKKRVKVNKMKRNTWAHFDDLPKVPHYSNPFNLYSQLWVMYELLLRCPLNAENWARYIRQKMIYYTTGTPNRACENLHILNSQMKSRLEEKGIDWKKMLGVLNAQ